MELKRGDPWWAAVDPLLWPEGMEEELGAAGVWDAQHGDRQQELVFIGVGLDEARVRAAVGACLMGEDEMRDLPRLSNGAWILFDPLPEWPEEEEEEEEGGVHAH